MENTTSIPINRPLTIRALTDGLEALLRNGHAYTDQVKVTGQKKGPFVQITADRGSDAQACTCVLFGWNHSTGTSLITRGYHHHTSCPLWAGAK